MGELTCSAWIRGNDLFGVALILEERAAPVHELLQTVPLPPPVLNKVLLGVQGSGFRAEGSGFRVQGAGCRLQGSGFRVQGSGFRMKSACFMGIGLRVEV